MLILKRHSSVRAILSILLVSTLAIILLSLLTGCGESREVMNFRKDLNAQAQTVLAEMNRATDLGATASSDISSTRPRTGIEQTFTDSISQNIPPSNPAEMNVLVIQMKETQDNLVSLLKQMDSLEAPAQCESCVEQLELLREALSSTDEELASIKANVSFGASVIAIKNEEMDKLGSLDDIHLKERIYKEDFIKFYGGALTIYQDAMNKWKALEAPENVKEDLEKIISAEQLLIELMQRYVEMEGPSGLIAVQKDMSAQEASASNAQNAALSQAYEAVRNKLTEANMHINDLKIQVEDIVNQ